MSKDKILIIVCICLISCIILKVGLDKKQKSLNQIKIQSNSSELMDFNNNQKTNLDEDLGLIDWLVVVVYAVI